MIVQPELMQYREPVYCKVAEQHNVYVVAEANYCCDTKLKFVRVRKIRFLNLLYQVGILYHYFRIRPNYVWCFANANYLSSVILTIIARICGSKVVLHGQGFIKKSKSNGLRIRVIRHWISFADAYVCYSESSRQSLIQSGVSPDKLRVIMNRFENAEQFESEPDGANPAFLFVGRLREHCGLESLVKALKEINSHRSNPVILHVVGNGPLRDRLKFEGKKWIEYHGELREPRDIATVAKKCIAGVYPGRAGLSVLTYLQMGLPVVCARDPEFHMGPEPTFLLEGHSAWFFDHKVADGLRDCLESVLKLVQHGAFCQNATDLFARIHSKSYGQEMVDCLESLSSR